MSDVLSTVAGGLVGGLGSVAGAFVQGEYDKSANKANLEHANKWNEQNQKNWEQEFAQSKENLAWQKDFSERQFASSNAATKYQQEFQREQYEYQKYLAENANQIKYKDLEKAGINPILAAGSNAINAAPISSGVSSTAGSSSLSSSGGGGKPSFQGANQRYGNIGQHFGNAAANFMAGAQLDLNARQVAVAEKQADSGEIMANAEAAYYNALARSIPTNTSARVTEVGATVKNAETNRMSVEQQAPKIAADTSKTLAEIPKVQAETEYTEAKTAETRVLTQQAVFNLETMMPQAYASALLDARIKEGQINIQKQTIIQYQLSNLILEQELLAKNLGNKLDPMLKEAQITKQELENATTQIILDQLQRGINPRDVDSSTLDGLVRETFPGKAAPWISRVVRWIDQVLKRIK